MSTGIINKLLSDLGNAAVNRNFRNTLTYMVPLLDAAGIYGKETHYSPADQAAALAFWAQAIYPTYKKPYTQLNSDAIKGLHRQALEWYCVITVAAADEKSIKIRDLARARCAQIQNACYDYLQDPPKTFLMSVPRSENPVARGLVVHLGNRT